MLSEKMLARLNEQIAYEQESASLYLQMSAWCDHAGYEGSAAFFRIHHNEELAHMYKLFDYVLETGGKALVAPVAAPPKEWASIRDVFEATLKHEKQITARINDLVDVAMSEKDYASFNFLQWYVAEQHEEEALFKSVLDKFDLVGDDKRGIFMVDREIGGMRSQAGAAG